MDKEPSLLKAPRVAPDPIPVTLVIVVHTQTVHIQEKDRNLSNPVQVPVGDNVLGVRRDTDNHRWQE